MKIRRILFMILLCLSLTVMFGCGGDGGNGDGTADGSGGGSVGDGNNSDGNGNGSDDGNGGSTDGAKPDGGSGEKMLRVTVMPSKGVRAPAVNPITVKYGESVSFYADIENGYLMKNVIGAKYDANTREVRIDSVTKDTRITLEAEAVGYDTGLAYTFMLSGGESDSASIKNGFSILVGGSIHVQSLEDAIFLGWSFGASVKDGGTIVSKDRDYYFNVKPEQASGDSLMIFANYTETTLNTVYYHANGGSINPNSKNITHTTYYKAEVENDVVKVTLGSKYFDHIGAVASLFWDDGSFTREGYVLKEFNTLPDGSGTGYDPGSKYPIKYEGSELYCIWAKESEHSDFSYRSVSFSYPTNVTAARAPHWDLNGIEITAYNGDDREIVIPEKIDGKTVTSIAQGAFVNKSVETLILSRFLIKVADGAFVGCSSLETIYYPDGIYYISDAAFDSESLQNMNNLYVKASIAPRRPTGDASFAKKFTRFVANPEYKRVAIVSGSSSFQGLSAEYLEALLGEEWCAVNFGTTRTTHLYLYMALLGAYADEDDIIIYAPENSIYEMGEPAFYWKTLRDIEGMYNVFRHTDMTGYTRVFTAFAEFNQGTGGSFSRYASNERCYEELINSYNIYGEYDHKNRHQYNQSSLYSASYDIRLDKYYVGTNGGLVDITESKYADNMNKTIERAKQNGAFVCFSFAPMADIDINTNTKAGGAAWFDAYEQLIEDTYCFDYVLGDAENYIFNVKYFYDNAFHPNDYGRVYRTYRVYTDICEELIGIPEEERTDYYVGARIDDQNRLVDENGVVLFDGSMFEVGSYGRPLTPADI